jgi:hypothetical protein
MCAITGCRVLVVENVKMLLGVGRRRCQPVFDAAFAAKRLPHLSTLFFFGYFELVG